MYKLPGSSSRCKSFSRNAHGVFGRDNHCFAAVRADASLSQFRDSEQVYLDLIGDSAHAVRGIDMATGKGSIRY